MAIEAGVWEAMCGPVRERYGAGEGRLRGIALGLLGWQAGRRAVAVPQTLAMGARLLVVQPDHLGGVLASTPAIRLIKETLPTAEVTVLAGPWGADAAEHCPAVDRVRRCRFPAFERGAKGAGLAGSVRSRMGPLARAFEVAEELRSERYDAAAVLVPDYWSAAVTALARIPIRVGVAGGGAERFLTHRVDVEAPPVGKVDPPAPVEHVAAAQLRIARTLVGLTERTPKSGFDERMAYEPTAADRADAVRLWRKHDLDEAKGVVAMHAAPGAPAKRWPTERFAILAEHVSGRLGGTVVLTGGSGDVDDVRAIAARCTRRPVDLAGQTSFGTLAALFERSRFVVGTDNGALHLATARGVPTLRLFGPTDARVWSGWTGSLESQPASTRSGATATLVSPRRCSPCHRLDIPDWRAVPGAIGEAYPCMDEISIEAAIDAVERVWRETNGR